MALMGFRKQKFAILLDFFQSLTLLSSRSIRFSCLTTSSVRPRIVRTFNFSTSPVRPRIVGTFNLSTSLVRTRIVGTFNSSTSPVRPRIVGTFNLSTSPVRPRIVGPLSRYIRRGGHQQSGQSDRKKNQSHLSLFSQ